VPFFAKGWAAVTGKIFINYRSGEDSGFAQVFAIHRLWVMHSPADPGDAASAQGVGA
jgi:hypothetical protein